jgi:hypothetical protein
MLLAGWADYKNMQHTAPYQRLLTAGPLAAAVTAARRARLTIMISFISQT